MQLFKLSYLNNYKHVVDTKSKQQKGYKVMQWTKGKAQKTAEAVRGCKRKHHREQAHDGKVNLTKIYIRKSNKL